eukprot:3599986-Rhodomonas_salina.1
MGCGYHSGRLFVLNGRTTAGNTNDLYHYDMQAETWSVSWVKGGVPPAARHGMGLVISGSAMYVF